MLTTVLGTLGMAEIQVVLSIVSLVMAHHLAYRHGQRTTRQRSVLWIASAITVGRGSPHLSFVENRYIEGASTTVTS